MWYKLLKKPFFGSFMVKWKSPLDEYESKMWQKIDVDSKSGAKLVGLFRKSLLNNPKATIILGHPMGKEAKGYFLKLGYADLLLSNGFNVIVFDLNGFGESTIGNFSYYEDIIAIGNKAKELTPNLKIGYHGISLGGQWATIAITDERHSYDFMIIESAATTLNEFWVHFPFAYKMLKILNLFLPKYTRKINMLERIKEAKKLKSILFIYSKTDKWTPITMGERFQKNCPIKSELWTIEEAKHAMVMKSDFSESYKQKIIQYFNDQI